MYETGAGVGGEEGGARAGACAGQQQQLEAEAEAEEVSSPRKTQDDWGMALKSPRGGEAATPPASRRSLLCARGSEGKKEGTTNESLLNELMGGEISCLVSAKTPRCHRQAWARLLSSLTFSALFSIVWAVISVVRSLIRLKVKFFLFLEKKVSPKVVLAWYHLYVHTVWDTYIW